MTANDRRALAFALIGAAIAVGITPAGYGTTDLWNVLPFAIATVGGIWMFLSRTP